MPSHYLIQCWLIVYWTPSNKFQWNCNRVSNIFIEEDAFEYAVCNFIIVPPNCPGGDMLTTSLHDIANEMLDKDLFTSPSGIFGNVFLSRNHNTFSSFAEISHTYCSKLWWNVKACVCHSIFLHYKTISHTPASDNAKNLTDIDLTVGKRRQRIPEFHETFSGESPKLTIRVTS